MTNEKDLVPVFIPALGTVLLHAEDAKGSPLTETEVLRIRDVAPVIMMKLADAQRLDESRGYRDIDPENCWHDFQKLRDELGRIPSLPPGPRFAQVRADNEFQQAILDAQASLPQFKHLIAASASSGAMPMVKTRLVDGDNVAFMWLRNARECEAGFEAELFEVPTNFTRYHQGDVLVVPPESVMDWMVNDNGCLCGGFSIRLIRQRKPKAERDNFDKFIGVATYAPLPNKGMHPSGGSGTQ